MFSINDYRANSRVANGSSTEMTGLIVDGVVENQKKLNQYKERYQMSEI
jgi:hypothetical protein